MALTAAATPPTRFIDPQILSRIGNLALLARTVVDGFITGLHRSPHKGLSIDFAEHRPYMPGDDIRRIDWRVFARTDRLYIKEYEADTNTDFSVLLDVSRSMDFASRQISKLDYARFLAASLTYLANRQRDRVGFLSFDNDIVDYIPPSAKHLENIFFKLDQLQPGTQGELASPLLKAAGNLHRRSLLVLISDLYEEPNQIINALAELSLRGNDLMVFHILDPAELEFDYNSPSSFEDLETGERIPVIPEQLREQYQQHIQRHIDTLRQRCAEIRIDYALFTTTQPLDHALHHFLGERARLSRVR